MTDPAPPAAPVTASHAMARSAKPALAVATSQVTPRWAVRSWLVSLAPVAATGIALTSHWYLPNKQIDIPTRIYPLVLQWIGALCVLALLLQWPFRWFRGWARPKAPIWAAAILIVCALDLITLKFALMPLPYFPGPDMVLQAIVDEWQVLAEAAYHSLALLGTGYLVGVIAGLVSGVIIGWSNAARYWAMPLIKVIGPIPATAWIPLVMVLMPTSFSSGVTLIGLAVWFPVTMLTSSGVSNVRLSYLDVARTLGASRSFLIFRVAIPSALPSIFIGLFMGLVTSFLTLVVAEMLGVKSGLGWYVQWKQGWAEYASVYGALLITAVFFSTIMTLLFKLRDRVLIWQKGVIKW